VYETSLTVKTTFEDLSEYAHRLNDRLFRNSVH